MACSDTALTQSCENNRVGCVQALGTSAPVCAPPFFRSSVLLCHVPCALRPVPCTTASHYAHAAPDGGYACTVGSLSIDLNLACLDDGATVSPLHVQHTETDSCSRALLPCHACSCCQLRTRASPCDATGGRPSFWPPSMVSALAIIVVLVFGCMSLV